jgi:hypothetical protein
MTSRLQPQNIRHTQGKCWLDDRWLGLGTSLTYPEKGIWFVTCLERPPAHPVDTEIDLESLVCCDETIVFFDKQHAWLIRGWEYDLDWLYCYDASALDLDRDSLRWVGEGYFADRNRVYYCDDRHFGAVPEADPASLAALPLPEYGDYHRETWRYFARDQGRVYCNGKAISTTTDTRLTNHEEYVILGGHLFYELLPLRRQDNGLLCAIPVERDFRLLSDRWGSDGVDLYLRLDKGNSSQGQWNSVVVISNADPATFQVLGEYYAKDARQVWRSRDGKSLGKVDAEHFSLFDADDGRLASDGRTLFYAGQRLTKTECSRFRRLGKSYWSDGKMHWWLGAEKPHAVPDLDPGSFVIAELADGEHATDKNSPWVGKERQAVDADTVALWRPFFETSPELRDYWWHRAQAKN